MRTPTIEDYRAYKGDHCGTLWQKLSDDWTCPGCGRTKFQIMRWTRKDWVSSTERRKHWGWKAAFHRHHDHGATERFPQVVICDHCNGFDSAVKRRYREIEKWFSWTPEEIRSAIKASDHCGHKINYERAYEIYLKTIEVKP